MGLLTACAGGNGVVPSAPSSVGPQLAAGLLGSQRGHGALHKARRTATEAVLYSFNGATGAQPYASLINVRGTFYGTTSSGGAHGDGTVFTITASGKESVLYSFAGGSDGATPYGNLTNVGGTLYGTTAYGGTNNFGTVFSISTSGAESVLHSFASRYSRTDGSIPFAGLTNVDGTLYGTTVYGGPDDDGTVFTITTSGTYNLLYSFKGNYNHDGEFVYGQLVDVNGTLYGTTEDGGGSYNCYNGCGTVYSITTSGTETVLHTFTSGSDGKAPIAGLTNLDGTLYGTTVDGGASSDGTVFKIGTSGGYSQLYSFAGGTDGAAPYGGLNNVNGTLYGATSAGGSACGSNGCGTIFDITTSGTENVLYSFAGGSDGQQPYASMTNVDGTLYGTTGLGGTSGDGTVFALSSLPLNERVLHNFGGGSGDGTTPYAPLINIAGTLYGTTLDGGASNAGSVFSIGPYGTESVLHSFTGNPDGQNPYAGLVSRKGTLYGTTPAGGAYGAGTVYSITPYGAESVIQSFYPGSDGQVPYAGLIAGSSQAYGTTSAGGVYNAGTVFSIKTSGKAETVFHSFGGPRDGTNPQAPPLDAGKTLFGTTTSGGAYSGGTVFAIAKSTGHETLLHSFGGSSGDGAHPLYGQLVSLGGTLYGTTLSGGAFGRGTVFSITPSGGESVLHSFGGGSGDGTDPYAGLIAANGTLYGTTSGGGANGAGTLYSITPYGTVTILWNFGNGYDGAKPRAGLIDVNGLLYGTTTQGGTYGGGTVFSLSL